MQDRAIAAIGKLEMGKLTYNQPYQFFVENMFPGRDYKMLLAVFEVLKEDGEISAELKQVDIDVVGEGTYQRYLYRKGSSRGGDITITTKAGDLEKKLGNFLKPQLQSAYQLAQKLELGKEAAIIGALITLIESQFEHITRELQSVFETLDKKEQQSTGFSFRVIVDGEEKYLDDFRVFQAQILSSGVEGKKEKYSVYSAAENQVCSICQLVKPEVLGFASPFKFATVDKPGMVAGFFKQKNNWKNYPICTDCSLEFELGQKFVANKLKRYFYGLSYFLIPKSVIQGDSNTLQKAIRLLEEIDYQASVKDQEVIQRREDFVMHKLGECENSFSLNLLFFEENPTTKAISINLMLEEILPSRFRKLFIEAPKAINSHEWYKDAIIIKKQKYDLAFSFGLIKEFFEDQFYEMIHKVFRGEKLALENMWSHFTKVIRSNHAEGKSSYWTVLKAHLLIRYFAQLGLIDIHPQPPVKIMDTPTQESPKGKQAYNKKFDRAQLETFVRDNPEFFDQDYKKGVFAVGILVRLLLNIQSVTLNGNTPFEKKLKGLNLNHEALIGIYVEALNKLSQFKYGNSNFFIQVYIELREFISDHFTLEAHKLSKISNNELSFYFVAGLEMGTKFKLDLENIESPENLD